MRATEIGSRPTLPSGCVNRIRFAASALGIAADWPRRTGRLAVPAVGLCAAAILLSGGCSTQTAKPKKPQIIKQQLSNTSPVSIRRRMLPASPESQGLSTTKISQLADMVSHWCTGGQLTGAELLVVKNRRTVLHYGAGRSEEGHGAALERNQAFLLGTLSEPLMGVATRSLAEDGLLRLDDPVADYVPEFDRPGLREIRIHHLLSHSSGLLERAPEEFCKETDSAVVGAAQWAGFGQEFAAGSAYRHTPGDLVTLAAVLERASRQPLHQVLSTRVLGPLGMGSTTVESGTMMQGTALDYATLMAAGIDAQQSKAKSWFAGSPDRSSQVEPDDDELKTRFTGARLAYGLSWILSYDDEPSAERPRAFGHAGPDGSLAWAWPDTDLIVVCLCHGGNNATRLALEAAIERCLLQPGDDKVAVERTIDGSSEVESSG